jgi:hypothetical protein
VCRERERGRRQRRRSGGCDDGLVGGRPGGHPLLSAGVMVVMCPGGHPLFSAGVMVVVPLVLSGG